MSFKPGTTFLLKPYSCSLVKVGSYNFGVIKRYRNAHHRIPAKDQSPIGGSFASIPAYANAAHNPIFKDMSNPVGSDSIVRVFTQMSGQPHRNAIGHNALRQFPTGTATGATALLACTLLPPATRTTTMAHSLNHVSIDCGAVFYARHDRMSALITCVKRIIAAIVD